MKYLGYALVLILGLAFQTAATPSLFVLGFRPELVLLLALLFALIQGPLEGAIVGFGGGLMLDLLVGRFIGLRALTFMLSSIGIGLVAKRLYQENFLVRFLAISGWSLVAQLLYLLGTAAFGRIIVWTYPTWRAILGTSIFNGLLSVVLFRPFLALNKRLIYWDELFKRTG